MDAGGGDCRFNGGGRSAPKPRNEAPRGDSGIPSEPAGSLLAGLAGRFNLLLAIGFMAISFFAFLTLLSVADLSFAVPATALSFVLETFLAKYVLKERVTAARWAGVGLVACGVALLAL